MNIRGHISYRAALKDIYRESKTIKKSLSLEQLAQAVGSHGSFLSNVFNEKAHINSDQLRSLCDAFKLSEEDWFYLDLLLQWERSQSPARTRYLKKQIDALHVKRPKTQQVIQNVESVKAESETIDRYYSNPFCKVVHIFLGIDYYAELPKRILDCLPIAESELVQILNTLVELKMIEMNDKKIRILRKNLHLPKDANICRPHQILMRQISQLKYQISPKENLETISVTFSADEHTFEQIHKRYLEFLNHAKKLVESCEQPKSVYQINFDLFPWS